MRFETVLVIETEAETTGEAQRVVEGSLGGGDPRIISVVFVNTTAQREPMRAPAVTTHAVPPGMVPSIYVKTAT